ncbi:hypothetical protein ABIA33_007124 [Streptacidiphilus sp. MAP12-16]
MAQALRAHGLTVDDTRAELLNVTALDWRKRLPQ